MAYVEFPQCLKLPHLELTWDGDRRLPLYAGESDGTNVILCWTNLDTGRGFFLTTKSPADNVCYELEQYILSVEGIEP